LDVSGVPRRPAKNERTISARINQRNEPDKNSRELMKTSVDLGSSITLIIRRAFSQARRQEITQKLKGHGLAVGL
jgi:hypothetical protein